MAKKKTQIKTTTQRVNENKLVVFNNRIKDWYASHGALRYLWSGMLLLISVFLADKISQITLKSNGEIRFIHPLSFIYAFTTIIGILSILLLLFVFHAIWYFLGQITKAESVKDEKLNFQRAVDDDSCGSADRETAKDWEYVVDEMTGEIVYEEDNLKKKFGTSQNYRSADLILGKDRYDTTIKYCYKPFTGVNANLVGIGSPGSGKSTAVVLPAIFQYAREGASMVVVDPKMELCSRTRKMLEHRGYIVKCLNLNPKQLLHSDSIDLLKGIGSDALLAASFSETYLANTSDGEHDVGFWTDNEKSLFTGCILYVIASDEYDSTMEGLFKFINESTIASLRNLNLPETHPAYGYFQTFKKIDDKVAPGVLSGMAIRMQMFNDPKVRKVTSIDDIDLLLPGKEKCAYFIGAYDANSTLHFVSALTFSLMYDELINYANSQPTGCTDVPVKMIHDEFYNAGIIPNFMNRLTAARSRGIDIMIFIQSVGQLDDMYGEQGRKIILDACSTHLLLRTNDIDTADLYSKKSGTTTVVTRSVRYPAIKGIGDTEKPYVFHTLTLGVKERLLYTTDEIMRLNIDNLLIYTSGENVLEAKKTYYWEHPMYKELRPIVETKHKPRWIDMLSESDKEWLGTDLDEVKFDNYDDIMPIELCTREEFLEEWNEDKTNELEKAIKEYNKKNKVNTPNYAADDKRKKEEIDALLGKDREEIPDLPKPKNGSNDISSLL